MILLLIHQLPVFFIFYTGQLFGDKILFHLPPLELTRELEKEDANVTEEVQEASEEEVAEVTETKEEKKETQEQE